MKITNINLNFKSNASSFASLAIKQNQSTSRQEEIENRVLDKATLFSFSYDVPEIVSVATGITGVTYFPYLLAKKVPQKENWSKFNTNLLKVGIPLCAYILADSLSYIFKGKRFFELFKKEKEMK